MISKAQDARVLPLRRLRGRTRRGRSALLDAALLSRERELIARCDGPFADALFVDVGVGEFPWTTLESAAAFRALNPSLRCIGCELDPLRLARARQWQSDGIEFAPMADAGFGLPPLRAAARLVRAMNVLRGYPEDAVPHAHAALAAPLCAGGLLLEGTSSGDGAVVCCHWIRKQPDGARREALLFATDFSLGFGPLLFRDWLPRDLRRQVRPGVAIGEFLFAWRAAFEARRAQGERSPVQLFVSSAERLAQQIPGIVLDPALLTRGCLLWQVPGDVVRPAV